MGGQGQVGGERGHHQGELQKEGEEGYVECILAWWCITIVLYHDNHLEGGRYSTARTIHIRPPIEHIMSTEEYQSSPPQTTLYE